MNLEKLGVTLAIPSTTHITVDAESWAGLILGLHLHRANLLKACEAIRLENSDGSNERLAEVQSCLIGMASGIDTTLAELLRVGAAQGLRFQSTAEVSSH